MRATYTLLHETGGRRFSTRYLFQMRYLDRVPSGANGRNLAVCVLDEYGVAGGVTAQQRDRSAIL